LKNLPEGICCLTNLEILELSNNYLKSIPEGITCLSKLKILYLGANRLKIFPEGICDLTNLRDLHINFNQLKSIPEEIRCLTNLETLSICTNQLKRLPEGISGLTNLQNLYLADNKLKSIPEGIHCLVGLEALILQGNTGMVYPPYCLIENESTIETATIVKEYCGKHENPMRVERRKAVRAFLMTLNRRFKEDKKTPQYIPLIPYEVVQYIVNFTHMINWISCVNSDEQYERPSKISRME